MIIGGWLLIDFLIFYMIDLSIMWDCFEVCILFLGYVEEDCNEVELRRG